MQKQNQDLNQIVEKKLNESLIFISIVQENSLIKLYYFL